MEGRKDEWQAWENQRRFSMEKVESPLTGLLTLVINDLWQKRTAEFPGLLVEEYESVRTSMTVQIGQGHIPPLEWKSYGRVMEVARPPEQLKLALEFARQ